MLIIPRYVVTACETDHYILIIFVVISKEEESIYRKRLYILIILGRISINLNSVESFNTNKNRKIKLYIITFACYLFNNVR